MENYPGSKYCTCRREHDITIDEVIVEKGIIQRLPECLSKYQSKMSSIPADRIPSADELSKIMNTIGTFQDPTTIGVDRDCAKLTLKTTKDIRDKYVLSRLAWDPGIPDDLCELL